jgi:hypothetical protein
MTDSAAQRPDATPRTSQRDARNAGESASSDPHGSGELPGSDENEPVTPANVDDADLSFQLEAWVKARFPQDRSGVRETFIKDEFESRLTSYQKSAREWRVAQISLWSAVVVLGALISILAAFKTGHGFTIVAGTLVALLTTLTNALHPSQAADGYEDARLALRDEGWSLLNEMGDYAKEGETDDSRYKAFASAVRKIVTAKRTATKFTLGSPGSSQ